MNPDSLVGEFSAASVADTPNRCKQNHSRVIDRRPVLDFEIAR